MPKLYCTAGECGIEIQLLESSLSNIQQLYLVEPDSAFINKGTSKIKECFGRKFEVRI